MSKGGKPGTGLFEYVVSADPGVTIARVARDLAQMQQRMTDAGRDGPVVLVSLSIDEDGRVEMAFESRKTTK